MPMGHFTKEGSAEGSRTPRELFAEIIETLDPESAVVVSVTGDGISISTTNGDLDWTRTILSIALDLLDSEDVCNDPPTMLQ